MEKFVLILNSIDWIFAGVILIGGRYWGSQFFSFSKNKDLNFLCFATVFGAVWLVIKYYTVGIDKSEVANLFLTYVITTTFYKILAQKLFEMIESIPIFRSKKKETETVITVKGEVTDVEEKQQDLPKRD